VDHVVIVGLGRVGSHIATVLERLDIPHLVMELDAQQAAAFDERGIPTLFGDAANSEVLKHAGLDRARALVVALPDEAATEVVVAAARDLAPDLPIIARAATQSGVQRLHELGAAHVIHPELEGGLEVVRHTLLALGYPASQVQPYTDAVRRDQYDLAISTGEEHQVLDQLRNTVRGLEIAWRRLDADSPLVARTLAEANPRARTGASVIAVIRAQQVLPNPKSGTRFQAGDLIGLLGDSLQIAAFDQLFPSRVHVVPNTEQDQDADGTGAVLKQQGASE
jgi:CPA2 family monovalent cation:H+ antiporter-2